MKRGILTKKEPEKRLLMRLPKTGGRGNTGRITIRHRGGGARKLYRKIMFGQVQMGQKGRVSAIEYDPNRNALIMLVEYADGSKFYMLAPHGIRAGDEILCDEKTDVKIGNRMKLKNVPPGEQIYNIELMPGQGGTMVRSAGNSSRVEAHEGKYTQLAFPSSEIRRVLGESFCSIGMVSNPEFMYERVKNAGRSRLKGRRPHVRGTAMNPVDHPHGGGEGRQPIGLKYPKTPWGKPALGVKTRRSKKWTNTFIISRRKKKKKER
ncbi:MAG: 50S ribosomal protein L2 [Candidatus Wildermuthbacteria bacterium RIFCSPLOWO2_01_FULL_48_29]|uniref:Large ribosomal subunit protein uL2 n=2 Tax=Candidatus Wildermuthiibacteriota TaxID=1817923 RepID=A0A1G2RMV9_9BACT|nr:MAG: 50S ribosomal protein L2 [Candidatus Wildermuthbacteria bacterium RIFCSPHIGHO2_01_FULL_48_27b]OHA74180.1 MAG: 50S ribosomal protein L2 [Candidatus Wildermuthbacteria bacterium RIFCSPLOWO2_01_FULL_48_29]